MVIDSVKATVPKELRARIREHLYYAGKYGIPQHCEKKGFRSVIGFRNDLHGLIMYVHSIDPGLGSIFKTDFDQLPTLARFRYLKLRGQLNKVWISINLHK